MSKQWRREQREWLGGMFRGIRRACSRPVVRFGEAGAPDPGSWDEMLVHWGVGEEDVPAVRRYYRWRLACFGAVQILALIFAVADIYAGNRSVWTCLSFLLATAVCVLAMVLCLWRLEMYAERTFCPLWRWLLAGFQIPEAFFQLPSEDQAPARLHAAQDCEVLQ